LGWDCDTERLHAHRAQSPTSEQIMGVQAAVWLAYEALPCFPNGMAGNRMQSTGFSRHQRQNWLTWPLWDRPIPLGTAQTLLAVAELHRERPRFAELHRRGGVAVFRSLRQLVGTKGYAILKPATLVG